MTTIGNTVLADNAYGTISSALSAVDTTLPFTSGHGARFPVVASPNVMYCVILNSGNVLEEIKITAHTSGSDSATIVRGVGGTTAKTWSAGDRIEARVSSAVLDGITSGSGTMVSTTVFGVVGDGIVNDTVALLAFFNFCINNQIAGYIPAGTYLITEGQLVFDNNFVDTAWPDIFTAGHDSVTFLAANSANAPMLTFSNGTANSTSGKYWRGGSLGGITFSDTSGAVATGRHGISIRGTWGIKFGWMRFNDLCGDGVNLPEFLYSSTNPDPYASSFTEFEAIEANRCAGWTLRNLNWVGMDSWHIKTIRSIECVSGVMKGIGSGCEIDTFSVGSCQGWAFDDGTNAASTGGSPNRNKIHLAEFDNCQNGIRLNKGFMIDFEQIRFVHRYQTSPNGSPEYWPRTVVDLCGGVSPNLRQVSMQIRHRIEAGGAVGTLGTFINGHSDGNAVDVNIDQDYTDEGSIGVTDALLFTSMGGSAVYHLTKITASLLDSRDKGHSFGRGSASTQLPNGGFAGGTTDLLAFPTQVFTTYTSKYDTSTSTYTAKHGGLYLVHVCLPLTIAIGTRVRMAMWLNGAVSLGSKTQYATTANAAYYELTTFAVLAKGDTLRITADQNSGSAQNCTPVGDNQEVRFMVIEL